MLHLLIYGHGRERANKNVFNTTLKTRMWLMVQIGFQAPQRNNDQACGAVGEKLWVVERGKPTWLNPTTV